MVHVAKLGAEMPSSLSCRLNFQAVESLRRVGEPVTVGLPWPRGAVTDDRRFRLIAPDGSTQPLQTAVLDRWGDGSIRWCLFDFFATIDGPTPGYRIEVADTSTAASEGTFPKLPEDRLFRLTIENIHQGFSEDVRPTRVMATGPIRKRMELGVPNLAGCELYGFVDFFAGRNVCRVQLTVHNPQPADHPGGNWDLGNGGSIFLKEFSITVPLVNAGFELSPERGQPRRAVGPFEFYQASSGGENWNSSNHITKDRKVVLPFRGYRVTGGEALGGHRGTPTVTAKAADRQAGVSMPYFWENFPKSISADANGLTLGLFPKQAELTELQGGEQKTHTFYLAFGPDTVSEQPLDWCRSPLVCHADPEWYAASAAVPYLTPKATDPHSGYLGLVELAVDGADTFAKKRETIDEFGWRNFGDIYGDHEATKHRGPTPMISHYNNQYDCIAAFLIQFFRSGDLQWLMQGLECADHTMDIDVYYTVKDKAAYNGGLFWHTYHYADADTANHRSYPKALTRGPVESLTEKMDQLGETAKQLQKSYAVGGGPASSHNYNAGLMLAYFLTGNPEYRDTAVGLAKFVLDMEDPSRTPFRFLSRAATGLATESGGGGYHGPGRAAGNSILALLVGHRLTGDARYLAKAEELIRRVVHPKQNLDRLDLLNAELRWFYTMTLQAIGMYLDHKIELNQLDRMYGYARLTLLHYARWMATHERPILDTPEKLQYPNETWAAQDMRKVEVFQYAAKHATGDEQAKFLERAGWFFDYVQTKLPTFETKSLCRPVILMMKYGWSHNWWVQNPTASAPPPSVTVTADEFGTWSMYVPQKARAIKRAKMIVVLGGLLGVLSFAGLLWWLLG